MSYRFTLHLSENPFVFGFHILTVDENSVAQKALRHPLFFQSQSVYINKLGIKEVAFLVFTYIPPLINQILLTALQLPTSICLPGSSILASSFACWSIGTCFNQVELVSTACR